MYCTACGKEIHNDAVICVECGVGTSNRINGVIENEGSLIGWSILGFFVPAVALILYLIWKEERPKTAKALAKGGIAYLIVIGAIITFYVFIFTVMITLAVLTM